MHESPRGSRSRRWGQNFLVNERAAASIVEALAPRSDETVIEIGPGHGVLTGRLVGTVSRLVAVEIDPDLARDLHNRFEREIIGGRLEIVRGDVLRIDLERLLAGHSPAAERVRLIANLPYNIAARVITRCLPLAHRLSEMLVMVQREVAERIASGPGSRAYGGLSVLCQAAARVERVMRLRPGSFRPRPRVESEVIRLVLERGRIEAADLEGLSALLRVAFEQRRKTLVNNLSRLSGLGVDRARLLIEQVGLEPSARPEEIPVEGYRALLSAWREV